MQVYAGLGVRKRREYGRVLGAGNTQQCNLSPQTVYICVLSVHSVQSVQFVQFVHRIEEVIISAVTLNHQKKKTFCCFVR